MDDLFRICNFHGCQLYAVRLTIAAALSQTKTNSYSIEVHIYEEGIEMYPFALLNHLSIHLNEVVTLEGQAVDFCQILKHPSNLWYTNQKRPTTAET
jgi:hypothetical protein